MELKTIFGLPAHPLLVHVPVVLLPLAGLIAFVLAFRPAWLDRYGWWLVVLSGVGAIGGILAAGSGEGLETLQNEAETAAREDHFNLGETARNMGILFFVIVVAVVLIRYVARKRRAEGGFWGAARSQAGAVVMSVALVLSAGAATYTVAKAGHQGAKLVWQEETAKKGGDQGNDQGGDEAPADTMVTTGG